MIGQTQAPTHNEIRALLPNHQLGLMNYAAANAPSLLSAVLVPLHFGGQQGHT